MKLIRFMEKNSEKTIENNKGCICLPYVKELENFNNFLKKYSTKVVYSAKNKLNNIIKLGKGKNEKFNNANVVYKINCNDCNASYVGQTSRRVNVRIKEYIKKYTDKDTNSGLFTHTMDNNHVIDFKNIKILDSEIHNGKRHFSEALFIHTQKNYMNKHMSSTDYTMNITRLLKSANF